MGPSLTDRAHQMMQIETVGVESSEISRDVGWMQVGCCQKLEDAEAATDGMATFPRPQF
jgi:hypothetical protein